MLDAATEDAGELTASEAWQQLQEILEENVPKLAAGIRKGEFPVFNHDAKCTTNCEFSTVCRVGQIRALAEIKHKTWNLEHL